MNEQLKNSSTPQGKAPWKAVASLALWIISLTCILVYGIGNAVETPGVSALYAWAGVVTMIVLLGFVLVLEVIAIRSWVRQDGHDR